MKSSSNLILPLSIVVAGMIIGAFTAGAIIYTNRNSVGTGAQQAGPVPQVRTITAAPITPGDHILGNISAPVKLIDYSDLECPFCKRHHNTLGVLAERYNDSDFAWVYRHLPLSFHVQAMPQSIASECVADLAGDEAFWYFIGRIYEVTTSNDGLDMDLIPQFATEAGVTDMEAFNTCYEEEYTRDRVEADIADAESAGGSGTPYAFLVSDKKITDKVREDIFNFALSQGMNDYVYFSDDNKAIGVSGALPVEAFEGIIDRLIAHNS